MDINTKKTDRKVCAERGYSPASTGKIIGYDLCSGPTINSLRKKVEEVVRFGWQPIGGVVYGPDPERGPWHQTVVWLDSEHLIEAGEQKEQKDPGEGTGTKVSEKAGNATTGDVLTVLFRLQKLEETSADSWDRIVKDTTNIFDRLASLEKKVAALASNTVDKKQNQKHQSKTKSSKRSGK